MSRFFVTNNEEETMDIAYKLSQSVPRGSVFCLMGDLGAGKTTFVKGFAKGLGISETVNSPTFNIMKIYHFDDEGLLIHIDAYRLYNEVINIGLEDFIGYEDGYTMIEWPRYIEDLLPFDCITVDIKIVKGDERSIEITGSDDYLAEI
ncbi:MAG: tRNA (adenosine(37)-N6)-threonylcarbamoyltransferase complex ATPase subunit type 1 TsaE [Coprobacillus sp.]|nr:tRNA (adenosine(37)-N6)-threonylcarbamoyltransferase complex ATPase subunit type 1 TsaE [Coprobacillus sp.]